MTIFRHQLLAFLTIIHFKDVERLSSRSYRYAVKGDIDWAGTM